MATSIALSLSGGTVPGGGSTKWASGSAMPKNISPMPMPALNIMAIQDTVWNSGASPSLPSGTDPYRLKASHTAKITKPVAASTNAHPPLVTSQANPASAAAASVSVDSTPQPTKKTVMTAVTPK